MNFLDKKGINLNVLSLVVKNVDGKLYFRNKSKKECIYILPRVFFSQTRRVFVDIGGSVKNGEVCKLNILNRKRESLLSTDINYKKFSTNLSSRLFVVVLRIPGGSEVTINKLEIDTNYEEDFEYRDFFYADTLLITPVYPSIGNRYSGGFVHTRAKAYIDAGMSLDVALITSSKEGSKYEYEGVKVFSGNYSDMRRILQLNKYKRILIHFFDPNYANVLDACNLDGTKLYFYLHGAETLYWDWNKITSPYFKRQDTLSEDLIKEFRYRDKVIQKYNENENAKWVFVTPWTKSRSEELVGVKYHNSVCIPCWVNEKLFSEEKKNPKLRTKIFVLRKFDNINTYSIDTVVRTILELSKRKFFSELEFNIYGDGSLFDFLLAPVKHFSNVNLYKKFLTHKEIRQIHQTHGIALFPTRFDSQAVSSCEAASSGCVVISSENPGVQQYILPEFGTLCDPENYIEYADLIERFYKDKSLFEKVNSEIHKAVRSKCSYEATIQRELDMFKAEKYIESDYEKWDKDPILTVVIPSYNVEKYLKHTVYSILNHRNRNKLEVLIVNDGSQDGTQVLGKNLMSYYNKNGKQLVRLINKENGGHGSTINRGIKEARGKYLKVVDGDDTVDSFEFTKLIDILEGEDVDVVLNDYIEDFAKDGVRNLKNLYEFLTPGVEYKFDDLCYEGYGFSQWGPILATSSYKTEMLKSAGFALSEKMFYVDMELNTYIAIYTKTVKYYPLGVYRYLLGNQGQSVSKASYTKNYKHHENVTIKMLEILHKAKGISFNKKEYIKNKLIVPMIKTQYSIALEYVRTKRSFNSFDNRLKLFESFYHDNRIATNVIKLHRRTKGVFVRLFKFLSK